MCAGTACFAASRVQRMVTRGVEMLIGVVGDPVFGPVVACGAGGVYAELLKDPVIAGPEGATVVDARMRIESARPRPPWPAA